MIPSTSLIPIHDDNPTRGFSYVTVGIIALNVLVFLTEPHFGRGADPVLAEYLYRWGLVPWEITHGHQLSLTGCLGACFTNKNVYLPLVTSMFLHAGPLHLAGNMLFLWVFGNNIEDTLGRVRFRRLLPAVRHDCRPGARGAQPGLGVSDGRCQRGH